MKNTKKTGYNLAALKTALDSVDRENASVHISTSNSKLGHIASFNLLPVLTCSATACKTCAVEGCYAVKNALCHGYDPAKNNALRAWAENTYIAFNNLERLEAELDRFLAAYAFNNRFFRIHSSGDFFSVEYAEMWKRLAIKHRGIKFLAFTKQWDITRGVNFSEVENFSLVPSGWTGCEIPGDFAGEYKCAYCVERGETPPEGALECPGNCDSCGMCWSLQQIGKDVYFNKH